MAKTIVENGTELQMKNKSAWLAVKALANKGEIAEAALKAYQMMYSKIRSTAENFPANDVEDFCQDVFEEIQKHIDGYRPYSVVLSTPAVKRLKIKKALERGIITENEYAQLESVENVINKDVENAVDLLRKVNYAFPELNIELYVQTGYSYIMNYVSFVSQETTAKLKGLTRGDYFRIQAINKGTAHEKKNETINDLKRYEKNSIPVSITKFDERQDDDDTASLMPKALVSRSAEQSFLDDYDAMRNDKIESILGTDGKIRKGTWKKIALCWAEIREYLDLTLLNEEELAILRERGLDY